MHDSIVESAALEAAIADEPEIKLLALELKLKALDKKKALLDEFGLLPHFEPPNFDHAAELGEEFVKVIRRHGVCTEEIVCEVVGVLEAWRTGSGDPPVFEGPLQG
jgi:hypothetical protein